LNVANTDVARSLKDNGLASPSSSSESPRMTADSQESREDTLRKLAGESHERGKVHTPTVAPTGPISLAAFIGGRATGPRLNKHAPQQDSHNPTQFEQRTITAPHPVFGRGGIAMPGMTGQGRAKLEASPSPAPKLVAFQTAVGERPVTPSSREGPDMQTRARDLGDHRSVSPEKTSSLTVNQLPSPRQRTQSNATVPTKSPSPSPLKEPSFPKSSVRHSPHNSISGDYLAAKSMPTTGRQTPTSHTPYTTPPRTSSVSPIPKTSVTISSSPPKAYASGASPSVAKTIQSTPKPLQSPHVSLNQSPSAATFLRPPPAKDPTPSISRLQGRGFVQNMVRASTQFEAASHSGRGPSAAATPEKERDTPRKATVLDRWQFNNGSSAPIIAPKPVPLRKSRTVDSSLSSTSTSPVPTPFNPAAATPVRRDPSEKGLKSVTSLPSIAHAMTPDKVLRPTSARNEATSHSPPMSQKRSLGSSTTMISYIKPLKTGDNPPTSTPPSRPSSRASRTSRSRPTSPDVDELGVRSRSRSRSVAGNVEVKQAGSPATATGGKSLSHVRSFW
jgi:hypothetical protein